MGKSLEYVTHDGVDAHMHLGVLVNTTTALKPSNSSSVDTKPAPINASVAKMTDSSSPIPTNTSSPDPVTLSFSLHITKSNSKAVQSTGKNAEKEEEGEARKRWRREDGDKRGLEKSSAEGQNTRRYRNRYGKEGMLKNDLGQSGIPFPNPRSLTSTLVGGGGNSFVEASVEGMRDLMAKDPSLSGSPKLVVTSTLSLRLLTAALIFAGCIATAHHALSETTSKGESEKFDLPKTPKGAVVFSPALCPSSASTCEGSKEAKRQRDWAWTGGIVDSWNCIKDVLRDFKCCKKDKNQEGRKCFVKAVHMELIIFPSLVAAETINALMYKTKNGNSLSFHPSAVAITADGFLALSALISLLIAFTSRPTPALERLRGMGFWGSQLEQVSMFVEDAAPTFWEWTRSLGYAFWSILSYQFSLTLLANEGLMMYGLTRVGTIVLADLLFWIISKSTGKQTWTPLGLILCLVGMAAGFIFCKTDIDSQENLSQIPPRLRWSYWTIATGAIACLHLPPSLPRGTQTPTNNTQIGNADREIYPARQAALRLLTHLQSGWLQVIMFLLNLTPAAAAMGQLSARSPKLSHLFQGWQSAESVAVACTALAAAGREFEFPGSMNRRRVLGLEGVVTGLVLLTFDLLSEHRGLTLVATIAAGVILVSACVSSFVSDRETRLTNSTLRPTHAEPVGMYVYMYTCIYIYIFI
ncbi:hypothetical protein AAMO2058_000981000 [Amorphochlora amoebiformis]